MNGRGLHVVVTLIIVAVTLLAPDAAVTAPVVAGAAAGRADSTDEIAPAPSADSIGAAAMPASAGMVRVTVTVVDPTPPPPPPPVGEPMPIYRFYSPVSGTHFYTPSADERDMVIARWPDVWNYEGIGYTVNPARNTQPLYRFYNYSNGSHFYTASASERDMVFARWANVFHYDGETYAVTPYEEVGKTPVYRFYNLKNGSHFYTASLDEANSVIARWPDIYRLEGVCFWLGQ